MYIIISYIILYHIILYYIILFYIISYYIKYIHISYIYIYISTSKGTSIFTFRGETFVFALWSCGVFFLPRPSDSTVTHLLCEGDAGSISEHRAIEGYLEGPTVPRPQRLNIQVVFFSRQHNKIVDFALTTWIWDSFQVGLTWHQHHCPASSNFLQYLLHLSIYIYIVYIHSVYIYIPYMYIYIYKSISRVF